MVYAYVAAALVIGLLIGVISLAIYWMARKVTHDINQRTRQLISAYDEILNRKSEELKRLSAQVSEEKAAASRPEAGGGEKTVVVIDDTAVVKVADIMNASNYRENGTDEVYRTIRDGIVENPLDALRKHAPYVFDTAGTKNSVSAVEELLKALDFDTVYELSLLPGEEQLSVLSESLSGEQLAILRGFAEGKDRFSVIDFCDELRSRAYTEQKKPTLFIPKRDESRRFPSGVNVVVDDSICEGFILEADNKLYDYSVRGREIS